MKNLIMLLLLCTSLTAFAQKAPQSPNNASSSFSMSPAEVLNLSEVKSAIGYPEDAQELGHEGSVRCLVKVNPEGKYITHYVDQSAGPILDQAVVEYLLELRFQPAMINGEPVTAWTPVVFRFRLTDD